MLEAEPGVGDRRTLQTVGVQTDWNFTVALRLPMAFSVGYAEASRTANGGATKFWFR